MKEKEQFEEWAQEQGLDLSILRNQFYEGYGDNATAQAWKAWQARALMETRRERAREALESAYRRAEARGKQ